MHLLVLLLELLKDHQDPVKFPLEDHRVSISAMNSGSSLISAMPIGIIIPQTIIYVAYLDKIVIL